MQHISVRRAAFRSHLRATFYKAELSGMIAPEQMEGKAKLFLEFEDRFNIHDSLILCRFYRDLYWDWSVLSRMVEMTTGLALGEAGLRKIASDIQNATRKEEIAAVIAFPASDDADYVNGVCIDINGGSYVT